MVKFEACLGSLKIKILKQDGWGTKDRPIPLAQLLALRLTPKDKKKNSRTLLDKISVVGKNAAD